MAMTAILDSVEQLDENLRTHYVQKEGKWHLQVVPVGGFALEDVKGLKGALEKERGQATSNAQQLARFEGIDPVQAKEDRQKVVDMASFNPEEQVKQGMKQRELEMTKKFEEEKLGLVTTNKSLTVKLEKNMIDAAATKAITDAEGSLALLLGNVKSHTRLRNDNGNYIVEVIGDDGVVRVGDSSGNPMTIPQYVEELKGKDDFAPAFAGSGASGSQGAGAGDRGGASKPNQTHKLAPNTVHHTDDEGRATNFEKIASGEVTVVYD